MFASNLLLFIQENFAIWIYYYRNMAKYFQTDAYIHNKGLMTEINKVIHYGME